MKRSSPFQDGYKGKPVKKLRTEADDLPHNHFMDVRAWVAENWNPSDVNDTKVDRNSIKQMSKSIETQIEGFRTKKQAMQDDSEEEIQNYKMEKKALVENIIQFHKQISTYMRQTHSLGAMRYIRNSIAFLERERHLILKTRGSSTKLKDKNPNKLRHKDYSILYDNLKIDGNVLDTNLLSYFHNHIKNQNMDTYHQILTTMKLHYKDYMNQQGESYQENQFQVIGSMKTQTMIQGSSDIDISLMLPSIDSEKQQNWLKSFGKYLEQQGIPFTMIESPRMPTMKVDMKSIHVDFTINNIYGVYNSLIIESIVEKLPNLAILIQLIKCLVTKKHLTNTSKRHGLSSYSWSLLIIAVAQHCQYLPTFSMPFEVVDDDITFYLIQKDSFKHHIELQLTNFKNCPIGDIFVKFFIYFAELFDHEHGYVSILENPEITQTKNKFSIEDPLEHRDLGSTLNIKEGLFFMFYEVLAKLQHKESMESIFKDELLVYKEHHSSENLQGIMIVPVNTKGMVAYVETYDGTQYKIPTLMHQNRALHQDIVQIEPLIEGHVYQVVNVVKRRKWISCSLRHMHKVHHDMEPIFYQNEIRPFPTFNFDKFEMVKDQLALTSKIVFACTLDDWSSTKLHPKLTIQYPIGLKYDMDTYLLANHLDIFQNMNFTTHFKTLPLQDSLQNNPSIYLFEPFHLKKMEYAVSIKSMTELNEEPIYSISIYIALPSAPEMGLNIETEAVMCQWECDKLGKVITEKSPTRVAVKPNHVLSYTTIVDLLKKRAKQVPKDQLSIYQDLQRFNRIGQNFAKSSHWHYHRFCQLPKLLLDMHQGQPISLRGLPETKYDLFFSNLEGYIEQVISQKWLSNAKVIYKTLHEKAASKLSNSLFPLLSAYSMNPSQKNMVERLQSKQMVPLMDLCREFLHLFKKNQAHSHQFKAILQYVARHNTTFTTNLTDGLYVSLLHPLTSQVDEYHINLLCGNVVLPPTIENLDQLHHQVEAWRDQQYLIYLQMTHYYQHQAGLFANIESFGDLMVSSSLHLALPLYIEKDPSFLPMRDRYKDIYSSFSL